MEKILFKRSIAVSSLEDFRHHLNQEMKAGGKTFLLNPEYNLAPLYSEYEQFLKIAPIKDNETKILELKASLRQKINECVSHSIQLSVEKDEVTGTTKSLLSDFAEHQTAIDNQVKDVLAPLIKKKHKIEKGFLRLNRASRGIKLTAAIIISGIALAFTIIGLVATPLGPAALILTLLTVASLTVTVGLLSASNYYAYKHKSHLTSVTFHQIFKKIGRMFVTASREKTDQLTSSVAHQTFINYYPPSSESTHLYDMHMPQDVFSQKKAEAPAPQPISSEEEQRPIPEQKDEIEIKDEEELAEAAWKDFAKKAKEEIAGLDFDPFDTLDLMQEALSNCDFELLSNETKSLLQSQLGINVETLEEELKRDSQAIKKLVRNFFSLNDINYIKFIGQQSILHQQKI